MDVVQSKRMCRKKGRTFNLFTRIYDMDKNNYGWDTITSYRESWTKELRKALGEFVEAAATEDMMILEMLWKVKKLRF